MSDMVTFTLILQTIVTLNDVMAIYVVSFM